ncbi:MAG TPA: SDR family NAD(P)-dependent oxidoreductase [Anaerolineales bacterium]|nr:SDR family NAD(P)-dependent oxidoreductase [Anaerolineales bacterium]
MKRLQDKVAIVTGGASGIGLATTELFVEEGARVIVFDINPQRTDLNLIPSSEDSHLSTLRVDVTSAAEVEAATRGVVETHGRIDILVNVAGGSGRKWGDGPTDACTLEGWDKTLRLNLNGVFYCCKYALQQMLTQQSGVIVNVSSVLGIVGGDEDFATHAYAASKGAIISLTRSIASYYAPRGIRANVICPGLIATAMSQRAQESDQIRSRLPQLQPLTGDFGSPKDVGHAALYLASAEASFVTGSVLTVDAGWTAR